jgi:hypothetical protein
MNDKVSWRWRRRGIAAACVVAVAVFASASGAEISGTSGSVTKIAPPPSVVAGALESDTTMYAFDEQQCVPAAAKLPVDVTQAGTYHLTSDLTPGTIAAGTPVSSHFVHADKVGDKIGKKVPPVTFSGSITVDQPILGIAVTDHSLDATDVLGAPGTVYPTGVFGRQLNLSGNQVDEITVSPDLKTVSLSIAVDRHVDQIRVITGCGADDTVRTDILDVNNNVITKASVGDIVHDKVYVTPTPTTPPSAPAPTGNVVFHLYGTVDCSGASTDETVGLAVDGTASSSPVTAQGDMSYRASYLGDPFYPPHDGACEPLSTTLPCPAGFFKTTLQPSGDVSIVFDQFPAPNDNSYGVNAVGWGGGGHKFNDLVGSDHSGYEVVNPSGTVVLDFFVDYVSKTTVSNAVPSGYASLGPFGGDGKVNVGSLTPSDVGWDSSLAEDLNASGYFSDVGGVATQSPATLNGTNGANLLLSSPPTVDTVSDYTLKTPNPWTGTWVDAAGKTWTGWDFHDTYYVTLRASKLVAIGAEDPTTHQLNPGWSIKPDAAGLHNSPAKQCPAPPPPTSASLATSAAVNKGTAVATPSFTLKANTTYLVFASTNSASGDSATVGSTFGGSPAFTPIGTGSQSYNNQNYDFGWWINGGASDSTGTITVTFAKTTHQAYLQVVELNGNDLSSPIAQSAYTTGSNTNPYTANLPGVPGSGDHEVAFLSSQEDLGPKPPTPTPSATASLVYAHAGPGSAGTYASDAATQSMSFAGGNRHWGTIAVEINHS